MGLSITALQSKPTTAVIKGFLAGLLWLGFWLPRTPYPGKLLTNGNRGSMTIEGAKNVIEPSFCHWTINAMPLNYTAFCRTLYLMSLDYTSFYRIIYFVIGSGFMSLQHIIQSENDIRGIESKFMSLYSPQTRAISDVSFGEICAQPQFILLSFTIAHSQV